MNYEILETSAFLKKGNQRIPVVAKYASRYSLWIKFQCDSDFTFNENCTLIVPVNGDSLEISPCKLIAEPSQEDHAGRLIFTRDIYDTQSLFLKRKVVRLQNAFANIPQILARKNLVKEPFRHFVSNLVYDLQVYKRLFDDFDRKLLEEPEETHKLVQKSLIDTEGLKFRQFFDSKVEELNRIVSDYTREEHQLHGSYFRNQLFQFIHCCPLMARTNSKPRGYAGDSKMMQMIYLNDYQGKSTFSKLMQKYTVETPAAQSVRNRQTIVLDSLKNLEKRLRIKPQNEIKILSVACGPAWEIKKILIKKSDFEKYHFSLLDQDRLALNEARQMIKEIETKLGAKARIDYVQASVRNMITNKVFNGAMGKFHFIYSMGLFDYLSSPVASKVIEKLYQLLSPQGELVAGNFHVSNSSRNFMEYWGDWYLIHRDSEEFFGLLNNDSNADVSIIFEDSKNQMFLRIVKPGKI